MRENVLDMNEVETSQDRWVRVISEWKTAALQWEAGEAGEAAMRGQDESDSLHQPHELQSEDTQQSWSNNTNTRARDNPFVEELDNYNFLQTHNKVGLTTYNWI